MIHMLYFMSFFVLHNGNHGALIRLIAGFAYKQAFDSWNKYVHDDQFNSQTALNGSTNGS